MSLLSRKALLRPILSTTSKPRRHFTSPPLPQPAKPTGDISSVFPSLSGTSSTPLPPRFAQLKHDLITQHGPAIHSSFHRLLRSLRHSTSRIRAAGPSIIPTLQFSDIAHSHIPNLTTFRDALHKHGCGVIRNVVTPAEALGWKELVQRYIRTNAASTHGFPSERPAVWELYWSPSQVLARAHPNVMSAQRFLMGHWHTSNKKEKEGDEALVSTRHPVAYADRLRIRQPGDAGFALGPHVDGGSCERWEREGYGRGGVYDAILQGRWEEYDPWEASCRVDAVSDLYNGAGGCSMFRMFQGWMAMSEVKGGEGHLMVNPLFREATAYYLLRPFFRPRSTIVAGEGFLREDNWVLEESSSSVLQGAVPASAQELNEALHPHLDLKHTMVHVPEVNPGDYVAWHCDTIHAVDKIHAGSSDSSVLYIPACPLTEANAEYLSRQRETFSEGLPAPDFPSGDGESQHIGRLTPDFVMQNIGTEAKQAMGLAKFDVERKDQRKNERLALERCNEILGFG